MHNNKISMEEDLIKISKTLKQHADNVEDLGLLYGKMGLVIFFFHLGRYTGDPSYEDFAMELLDNIQEHLYQCQTINYSCGLAGIGAGIEYLVQNGFVDADTNEILEEFDDRIADLTARSSRTDGSLLTGITGIGRYFLFRITGANALNEHIRTINCKMELIHITDILQRMMPALNKQDIDDVLLLFCQIEQINLYPVKVKQLITLIAPDAGSTPGNWIGNYMKNLETELEKNYKEYLSDNNEEIAGLARNDEWASHEGIAGHARNDKRVEGIAGHARNDKNGINPGLHGGLAGIGLYVMSQLDKRHKTWMKLL